MGIPRALRRSWEGGPFVMGKVSLTLANLLHVPEVVGVFHPLGKSVSSWRSFTAIRKDAGLCCGSRLRLGEVFAYVGLPQNLKDLKDGVRRPG